MQKITVTDPRYARLQQLHMPTSEIMDIRSAAVRARLACFSLILCLVLLVAAVRAVLPAT
jgi:hypothetical protein